VRLEVGYDHAVRAAAEYAAESDGRALVQDTAWEGYTEVPEWIVDGYQTLLEEVDEQLGGRSIWWWSRSGWGRWPRRWSGTTGAQALHTRACCRSSPTPLPAC